MKIIKIDGFKGLLTAAFIIAGLFAGFVISPGIVMMYLWNKYLVTLASFPIINEFQGVLLWGIIALSYIILSKGKYAVSFKQAPMISDPEMNMIIKNAKIYSKMKKLNNEISKSDRFTKVDNVISINDKKDLSNNINNSSNIDKEESVTSSK